MPFARTGISESKDPLSPVRLLGLGIGAGDDDVRWRTWPSDSCVSLSFSSRETGLGDLLRGNVQSFLRGGVGIFDVSELDDAIPAGEREIDCRFDTGLGDCGTPLAGYAGLITRVGFSLTGVVVAVACTSDPSDTDVILCVGGLELFWSRPTRRADTGEEV